MARLFKNCACDPVAWLAAVWKLFATAAATVLNSVGFDCESCCISLKNCPGVEIEVDAAPVIGGGMLLGLEVLVVTEPVLPTLLNSEVPTFPNRLLLTFIESSPGWRLKWF